jgi:hypothetical protein
MFQEVVTTVEYDTNKKFKFNHIDGEGLGCIIADAYPGQAIGKFFYNSNYLLIICVNNKFFIKSGIGQFLHLRDKNKSVEEHLKHIYITCIVHYNRYHPSIFITIKRFKY